MKKIQALLFSISFLLFMSSCVSIDDTMKSWIGSTKDELLQKWGPPTSVFPDGKEGEIYTYKFYRQTTGTSWTDRYGRTYYNPPQQYTSVRQFFINKEGIIYAYRWQGL